jgi:class 3 adenylate cyclase
MAEATQTFLFTDLVGFTALTAERGDDHGAEVALAFHDEVRALLPRFAATEVKSLGDGLMLHAAEPADGIDLALAIVDRLDARPDFPLVRVGVHSGPAVRRGDDWYGTTVNVAARLCSAAGGGQVLASATTLELAGSSCELELDEPRLHWLKNLREPVRASIVARRLHTPGWRRLMRVGRMRMPRTPDLQGAHP